MHTRTLLCVEPDEAAVAEIRRVLEPYGFMVENISNGEAAVDWARRHDPELIIVSVEPRKVGYAVCNKLKRSSELQQIPLILTSAEETLQTFEQHKKLKSRADEYVLKPFRAEELVSKVGNLVRLIEPGGSHNGTDKSHGVEVADELSVGDSDIVEVDIRKAQLRSPVPQQLFGSNPTQDVAFDQETDAAFDAIQAAGEATGPINTAQSYMAPTPMGPNDWDEEKTRTSMLPESGFAVDNGEIEPTASHLSLFAGEAYVPPSPDEVDAPATFTDAAQEARIADLTNRIHTLEHERHGHVDEIEQLKLRLQSQPLSKEKEFLSLREIINRKEKDILDLRDALDAKDRQILDHKDRVRENERARRDLDEKTLSVEKALMAAQERMGALAHDKEKSNEREKALKARLDDALMEIQKAHDEADTLKKRISQTEERARIDLEKVRADLQARTAEMEAHHRGEVARLSEARVAAEEDLKSEYESEISRLRAAQAAEIEAAQKRSTEEVANLNERLQGELARLRRDHEKAIAAAKEEQTVQLAAERHAHQEATETKERDHKNEILGLRRRHEEEALAAEERRQRELTETEARHVVELDTAEQRRRSELQTREEEHHGKLAEMDRLHFNEKTEAAERHRQEFDQAHARTARAEGELAARTEELAEAQRRLAGVEADRDAGRVDLRDREVKLGQLRDRAAELESKTVEYEDQILRAYQKLRSDEKVVEKAKRALAVALSLLDERTGSAAGVGAAPMAQATRTSGEESP